MAVVPKQQPHPSLPEPSGSQKGSTMSRRNNNPPSGRKKNKGRRTSQRTKASSRTYGRYWLTPKAWRHSCGRGCGSEQSVAYRASDHSYVCANCIERLGIKARPSQAWLDGGAGTDPNVHIRYMRAEEMVWE